MRLVKSCTLGLLFHLCIESRILNRDSCVRRDCGKQFPDAVVIRLWLIVILNCDTQLLLPTSIGTANQHCACRPLETSPSCSRVAFRSRVINNGFLVRTMCSVKPRPKVVWENDRAHHHGIDGKRDLLSLLVV